MEERTTIITEIEPIVDSEQTTSEAQKITDGYSEQGTLVTSEFVPAFLKPFEEYTTSEALLFVIAFILLVSTVYEFIRKRGI